MSSQRSSASEDDPSLPTVPLPSTQAMGDLWDCLTTVGDEDVEEQTTPAKKETEKEVKAEPSQTTRKRPRVAVVKPHKTLSEKEEEETERLWRHKD